VGKKYATQDEALIALKTFIKDTNLPKPTVINSGNGIHVYWILDQAIQTSDWRVLAEKFKLLCEQHKLHADTSVTADSARVLRIPETLNFKDPTNPVPVKAIGSLRGPVSISVIQDVLSKLSLPDDVFAGMSGKPFIPREMDALTLALMGNSQSRFKTIMVKTLKEEGCAQLLRIYQNQDTIEEPLWRAGLSIANNCVDRDTAIHKLSNKHPN
jgi:hypothetical protein